MEPVPSETHNGNVSPMCVVVINTINGEKKERKISLTTPCILDEKELGSWYIMFTIESRGNQWKGESAQHLML